MLYGPLLYTSTDLDFSWHLDVRFSIKVKIDFAEPRAGTCENFIGMLVSFFWV